MALSLFRFIAAAGRVQVIASTMGSFTLLTVFVLGGFIIARGMQIQPSCLLPMPVRIRMKSRLLPSLDISCT